MSYVFQVGKQKKFWDGKIAYCRSSSKKSRWYYGRQYSSQMQRKFLEEVKEDWKPNFSSEMTVIECARKAKRLISHYNIHRTLTGKKLPDVSIRVIEWKPVIVADADIDIATAQQIKEAKRIHDEFGATMAESYGRLCLKGLNPIFEVAVKRKGKSLDSVRELGFGHSHGMYTFFSTKGQYVTARLVLGDTIDRVYYLQQKADPREREDDPEE